MKKNKSSIHVAQIVCTYPPYKGGMGNVAQEMVTGLIGRGYQVTVLTPDYLKQGSENNVSRLKPWLKYGNAAWLGGIKKQLEQFDVIHLHYPFLGSALSVASFKRSHPDIPLVITYHMDLIGKGWKKQVFSFYSKIFAPYILNAADVIIVSSLDYARNSKILKSVKPTKIVELPIGVAEKFQQGQRRLQTAQINLLFVGGLDSAHYFKGLTVLFDALALIKKSYSDSQPQNQLHLKIVGSGNLSDYYHDYAEKKGIANQVEFLGKVDDADLVEAYKNAEITLLPSTDKTEAFGMVLAESMATGTPVIASDLPGVRSLVINGRTGLLVPPSNAAALAKAIPNLANDPYKREEMGQAGITHMNSRYRWPKIIDELEKIYSQLSV